MNNALALQDQSRHSDGALVQTESSRAIQEVQAAMVIAKKFPRDERRALDRILNACTRPALANAAIYQYARGGTDISGPSIRLAEAIAQQWGNIQFGIRELDQANGESTVEAFAWDLETNTRQTKTFQVPHVRHTKAGSRKLEDPRDIYELVANNGARRLRACILGVIPGDVVEEALTQCETTMTADADASPEAQKKIMEAFAKFGVTKEQIEARIQRRLDAITPAQVISLRKIMTSLKDGMSKPEEWFPSTSEPKAAVVPPPAKPKATDSKRKGSEGTSAPASGAEPTSELITDDPRIPAAEVVRGKMESEGVSWRKIQDWFEQNGDTIPAEDDATDGDFNAILKNWDSITF